MSSIYLRLLLLVFVLELLYACQSSAGQSHEFIAGQQILITFSLGEAHEAALLNSFAGGYHRGNYGPTLTVRRQIDAVAREYPVREQAGWAIDSLGVYCALFVVAQDVDVEHLLQRLGSDPRVESTQLLLTYRTRSGNGYNDPYFDLQYGHSKTYILNLHRWATGKGVEVAVIDTGVDTHHPELKEQVADTQDFLPEPDDEVWAEIHGTAIAGIIAARANNGSGIVGLAPEARIHVLQACKQLERESSLAECNSFTLAQALSFAVDRRFDIINLSLSGPYDPLVARLIEVALARGQVIAAADPGPGEGGRYPARLHGVIAVREDYDLPANDDGPEDALVVHAPRKEVLSTGPGGGYDYYSGTSVATAIVSGLAALSLQGDGEMSLRSRVDWLNQAMCLQAGQAVDTGADNPVAGIGQGVTPPHATEF